MALAKTCLIVIVCEIKELGNGWVEYCWFHINTGLKTVDSPSD